MYPPQTYEKLQVLVENPDSNNYRLKFTDPSSGDVFTTDSISADASAGTFEDLVEDFWDDYYSSNIDVTRTMLDSNGDETEDSDEMVAYLYEIEVEELQESDTVTYATVQTISTAATVTISLASEVQQSDPPLSGSFTVKCFNEDGDEAYTEVLAAGSSRSDITTALEEQETCRLYDKIDIWGCGSYSARTDGYELCIRFVGINADMGQFEFVSDSDDPITTSAGGTITFEAETLHDFGTNLMFEPIPHEMLRTYETQPQVSVTVGDLPVACHNLDCDYAYIDAVGEVTSFSISGTTLAISGTDLPDTIDDIESIYFAQAECEIDESSITDTYIECDITGDQVCGDFSPVYTTIYGVIEVTASDETITCTATDIDPSTDVSLLGGTVLTITGTYFPTDLDDNTVTIVFDDTQETECTPLTSSSTELTCTTDGFDKTDSLSATLTPTITINDQVISHSLTIDMNDAVESADSISPTSASPVLVTELVITLDSAFPETVNTDDYSVYITDQDDSTNVKYIKVVDADDTDKTLTLKFGGAWSGLYDVAVEHTDLGLIDTTDVGTFTVEATIESISPTTLSIYGGTLITITGTNFGTETTDNPVEIYFSDVADNIDCYVETTSETEITCRLDDDDID